MKQKYDVNRHAAFTFRNTSSQVLLLKQDKFLKKCHSVSNFREASGLVP